MCGIIGYIGGKEASRIVHDGLKILTYRGYDSSGIAVIDEEGINIQKDKGKLEDINFKIENLRGNIAIGHNRWGTTGNITQENAHPHMSCDENIAVVHNGIVENYIELREELIKKGHSFKSETDTEVIPHLIEEYSKENNYIDAVKKTIKRLEGRFAIVVMKKHFDGLIGARNGSPLVVGEKGEEKFLASDVPAFLNHTKKVYYLNDDEMVIAGKKLEFYSLKDDRKIEREANIIDWDAEQATKQGYEHYMIKEIMEQKETIEKAIAIPKERIMGFADELNKAFGIFFVACGTAYHAGLTASYIFSKFANKHINVVLASEFKHYVDFVTDKTLVIPISQSGETADVLEAIKAAKQKGAKIISVLNVIGSSIMRASDDYYMINAGPEMAVASTKAFIGQVALLTLLANACAGKLEEGKKYLKEISMKINLMFEDRIAEQIKELANKLKDKKSLFIIGRGFNYPIAMESALKIKEISYIHAEGFAGGELKHGTLALIEKDVPCIVFADGKKEIIANAEEIKARGGYIIGIAEENNPVFDYFVKVPKSDVILNVIPAQLIAYYLAVEKGLDPDKPRNLAKVLTVK
ncbi:glutamine--fructose-6-phosphate transaminase (isomerizing) [Candidatus Woesearchaeota archaeon]|nr:glutamine--fructose-6-phosphate transaminase (isomerizing) [Candidatus Woesearchaeota archaeon]